MTEIGKRRFYGERWWEWDGKIWIPSSEPSAESSVAGNKSYTGYTGQIEIRADEIILRRNGLKAKALRLAGPDRAIPLDELVGLSIKEATRLVNGHVQFHVAGSVPGTPKPADADTVVFTHGQAGDFQELFVLLHERIESNAAVTTQSRASAAGPASAGASSPPHIEQASDDLESLVVGRAGKKLLEEARKSCRANERPLFILAEGQAGGLVAFDDRCMIIKKGALTGFMAGSVGGGRVATFMYSEITGIEYNSGWVTGVLEILTPSYQGSANKDFRRGTTKGRNNDSNDPWTLSNTLPLTKSTYEQARSKLDTMRKLIAEAKRPQLMSAPVAQAATASLAEQIQALAELHKTGVLDDDEFKSAKARLLSAS